MVVAQEINFYDALSTIDSMTTLVASKRKGEEQEKLLLSSRRHKVPFLWGLSPDSYHLVVHATLVLSAEAPMLVK